MTESYYSSDPDQSGKDECLSDLQIAALIDNSLKASEKQVLFKHLNRCEDCRFCWMQASISITNSAPIENKASWSDRLRKLVSIELVPLKLGSGLAIITVAVFCAVLLWPMQKGVESMLDEQYALLAANQHSMQAKQAMKNMPLPWEHTSLSFAPTTLDTSALAFAAGLLDGRKTLSYDINEPVPPSLMTQQNPDENVAEQQIYFQLGRWMVSLWFVSQLDNNIAWNKQTVILDHFNSEFLRQNKNDQQTVKTLKMLQRISLALNEVQQTPNAKDNFRSQVERVMIQLSPDSLDE